MIAHRTPPRRFGKRAVAAPAPVFTSSDMRLFAVTYLSGAAFVLTLFG